MNKIENSRNIGGFTRSSDEGKPRFNLVPMCLKKSIRGMIGDHCDGTVLPFGMLEDFISGNVSECEHYTSLELLVRECLLIEYAESIESPDYADIVTRLAILYTNGAQVHGKWNWASVSNQEVIDSCIQSAERHLYKWVALETDEDHLAALIWNLYAIEYHRNKLNE